MNIEYIEDLATALRAKGEKAMISPTQLADLLDTVATYMRGADQALRHMELIEVLRDQLSPQERVSLEAKLPHELKALHGRLKQRLGVS